MKTTYLLSLLVALILLLSATAADVTPQKEVRYIDVTGSAEMLVEPNEVYFNIELKELLKGKTKVTLDTLEEQLNQAMRAASLPLNNLAVVKFNAAQYYKNRKNHDFMGTKNFRLKISTATQLNTFFLALGETDIRHIFYQYSSHSDYIQLRDENKVNAIKAAQNKAKAMVEAVGGKIGLPIYIVEGTEKNGPVAMQNQFVEIGHTANLSMTTVTASKYVGANDWDGAWDYGSYGKNSYTHTPVVPIGNDISFEKIRFYQEVKVRFEILSQ